MVQTEPLKFWTVFLSEKKRRAFFPFSFFFFFCFFFISCSLAKFITRKVCCVVLPIKCWHGGSVARVFWGQNVSCKKRWVHETASSTRIINGSCKHCIKEKKSATINEKNKKKTKQNKNVFNPSKSFSWLKKVNTRILLTFEKSFFKKNRKHTELTHFPLAKRWILLNGPR